MHRNTRFVILAFLFAVSAFPVTAQSTSAQDADQTIVVEETALDVQVREIASQLRCVVCQGLSLQDSPSELAQEMRAVIREKLNEGMTPDEVKQYFVGRYGEYILLEPEPTGFNLAVYVLPVIAVLIGAAVILVAVRRWSAQPTPAARTEHEPDPELAPWDG